MAPRVGQLGRALPLAIALLGLGCGGDDGGDAEPVFAPQTALTAWPEVRGCRLSIEHDAHHITVRVSPESASAYTGGTYPFAEETVLVKALFDDAACTDLVGFAAMKKLAPGASPEAGDWLWQRTDAAGAILESGALQACVSCHQGCTNGRDYACTDP